MRLTAPTLGEVQACVWSPRSCTEPITDRSCMSVDWSKPLGRRPGPFFPHAFSTAVFNVSSFAPDRFVAGAILACPTHTTAAQEGACFLRSLAYRVLSM